MNARDEEAIQRRIDGLLRFEETEPERLWYFSFADENGFRGAVITKTRGITSGLMKINRMGINPHGEVLANALPEGTPILDELLDRVLSKADLKAAFGEIVNQKGEPG